MPVPQTTLGQLQREVPTGTLVMYAAPAAPNGWLVCDGSAVKREQYRELFGIVGTTYGTGDGSTTFNLPNLTSKFPYGTTPGSTGGVASHTHGGGGTGTTLGGIGVGVAAGGTTIQSAINHTHTIASDGNLPPYLGLTFIIKT